MDEKYKGCNIVESVVTAPPPKEQKGEKKRAADSGVKSHFLMRLIISAFIIGVILVLHYFPTLPQANALTDTLRSVFCYDVFGRSGFGTSVFG